MRNFKFLPALLLALASAPLFAQSAPIVSVNTTRHPVDKSYRKMIQGMELFEKQHAMAPEAQLRFKLLPRLPSTDMQHIAVKVVGDSLTLPVVLDANNTFAIERNQTAWNEDAAVITNRKAGSMTWRADIRSPGLPANVRRLGDLRLECQVGLESDLVSEGLPIVSTLARAIRKLTNVCDSKDVHYFYFTDRPLFSVTLKDRGRTEVLAITELYAGALYDPPSAFQLAHMDCQALLDRTYFVPLGDHRWSDDTLVVFEYMDEERSQ